jgi:simple sugar transport system substrate-binding protein
MKKYKVAAAAAAAALLLAGCSSGGDSAGDKRYVVSVKLIGVGWFDNMEKGINAWATEKGMKILLLRELQELELFQMT